MELKIKKTHINIKLHEIEKNAVEKAQTWKTLQELHSSNLTYFISGRVKLLKVLTITEKSLYYSCRTQTNKTSNNWNWSKRTCRYILETNEFTRFKITERVVFPWTLNIKDVCDYKNCFQDEMIKWPEAFMIFFFEFFS